MHSLPSKANTSLSKVWRPQYSRCDRTKCIIRLQSLFTFLIKNLQIPTFGLSKLSAVSLSRITLLLIFVSKINFQSKVGLLSKFSALENILPIYQNKAYLTAVKLLITAHVPPIHTLSSFLICLRLLR